MESFSSLFQQVSAFLSVDPSILLMESVMIIAAALIAFFVMFATRDILLRTHSFVFQIFCIVIVALVPVIGFLLYILIRPSRTLAERRTDRKLDAILLKLHPVPSKKIGNNEKHVQHSKDQKKK